MSNADLLLMPGRKVLLTIDVREHACCIDDQDRRGDGLAALFRICLGERGAPTRRLDDPGRLCRNRLDGISGKDMK